MHLYCASFRFVCSWEDVRQSLSHFEQSSHSDEDQCALDICRERTLEGVLFVQVPALGRQDIVAKLLHDLMSKEGVALVLASRPFQEGFETLQAGRCAAVWNAVGAARSTVTQAWAAADHRPWTRNSFPFSRESA